MTHQNRPGPPDPDPRLADLGRVMLGILARHGLRPDAPPPPTVKPKR